MPDLTSGPNPFLPLFLGHGLGFRYAFPMKKNLPLILLLLYIIEFIVLAFHPVSRTTWISENVTVLLIVIPLIVLYLKGIRFSNTAYLLMSVLIFLHTIGGHYTFAKVPFDWVTDLIGAQRNHFDRICHFSVGLYAYAILEFIENRRLSTNRGFSIWFAMALILAVAGLFEIVEWLYAMGANPTAGAEFLGSQGDIWDAQRDMLADGLGGVVACLAYHFTHREGVISPCID